MHKRNGGGSPGGKQGDPGEWSDPEAFARWPRLMEHLTCDEWEDKTSRDRSTLIVFVEGYRWKVCLSAKSEGEVAFMTGDSLYGALDAIELGLVNDSLDWRVSREGRRKFGKGG